MDLLISKQQHELIVRPSLTLGNTDQTQIREATYLTSSLYVEIGTITTLVVTLKTANTSTQSTCVKWPLKHSDGFDILGEMGGGVKRSKKRNV